MSPLAVLAAAPPPGKHANHAAEVVILSLFGRVLIFSAFYFFMRRR